MHGSCSPGPGVKGVVLFGLNVTAKGPPLGTVRVQPLLALADSRCDFCGFAKVPKRQAQLWLPHRAKVPGVVILM